MSTEAEEKPPLTPEQIVALKRSLVKQFAGTLMEPFYKEDTVFTCDDCPSNGGCEYAFDGYNTDGDCLAIK